MLKRKDVFDADETLIKGGVGQDAVHDSAHKHVSGEAIYVDDRVELPGTLHIAVGKNDAFAHAKILKLDLSAVRAAPGVVDVISAADIPGENEIGNIFPGEVLLAEDKVEFIGQPIFAVAAETRAEALEALKLAEIEFEKLDPILSIDDAIERGEAYITDYSQGKGDPEKAIAEAPHQFDGGMFINGQEHFYLEGQVSTAVAGEDGKIELYMSTQNPSENQRAAARILGVQRNQVMVECRRMGGGFGGKETNATPWGCIAALVAKRTKRPAKLRLGRGDDMIMNGKRHPFQNSYKVGYDDDGRILGLLTTLRSDGGYSSDLSIPVIELAMFDSDNAYYLPNMKVTGNAYKTNKASNTAFRGFGGTQGVITVESMMDDVAYALGKDPLDVRKLNLLGTGERNTTHYGQVVENSCIEEVVDFFEEKTDYRARRAEIEAFNKTSKTLKRGIALMPLNVGCGVTVKFMNQAGVLLLVYADGSIHLNQGGTEMGQGLYVKVAQVVAQELQVDIDTIEVSATRVDKVPNTQPTAASMSSDLNGMAALNAAREIKGRLTTYAAEKYEVSEEDVRFVDNHIHVGDKKIPFAELVEAAYFDRIQLSASGFYAPPGRHYDNTTGQGAPYYYYLQGAAVCEVVMDTLTGEHKILQADLLMNVGGSLNPAVDIGQIEGAFIQGVGWLTTEELVWNDEGRFLSTGPATYKIPAVSDCPEKINLTLSDIGPEKPLLYRSKAIGEPPLFLGASVLSALRHAISESTDKPVVPRLDAPATPERVLKAVQAAKAG